MTRLDSHSKRPVVHPTEPGSKPAVKPAEGEGHLPYYSEPLLSEIDRLNQENTKLHALATLSALAAADAQAALESSFRVKLGGALIDATRDPRKLWSVVRILLEERRAKKARRAAKAKNAAAIAATPDPQPAGHPDLRKWLPRLSELVAAQGGDQAALTIKHEVTETMVLARLLAEIAILELETNSTSAIEIAEHAASLNPGEARLGWLCLELRGQNRDEEFQRMRARLNGALSPELARAISVS